jgi:excisionase family DNA binding protein
VPKQDSIPKNLTALTVSDAAKLFGVDARTVRNWINDKGLPATSDGHCRVLNWQKALAWFIQYRIEESGNSGNRPSSGACGEPIEWPESYDDALARKTRAEADLKELQLARERGEVAAIGDVGRVLASATKATQTIILALPSRLATQLVGLDDRGKVYAILQRECNGLLGNLARIEAMRETPLADAAAEGEE